MKKKNCYYCGKPATSKEHVPPQCLFPERKDSCGVDHRKNLITVPSCDEHNLEKSKDDEFLMVCLTSTVGNNAAGILQTWTKLRRAFDATNGRLLRAALRDIRPVRAVSRNGTIFPALIGEPDVPRLERVLEHVARGLYFHETGARFIGTCSTLASFITHPKDPDLEFRRIVGGWLVSREKDDWPVRGDNPEIFQYRLGPPDQYGLIPMLMTFFRGSEVIAAFKPEGVKDPPRFRKLSEATPDNPIRIEFRKAQ